MAFYVIIENDIAGGKVYSVPEVVDVPDNVAQCHPEWFRVNVLTQAQACKQAQHVELSHSLLASALSEDRLPPVGD